MLISQRLSTTCIDRSLLRPVLASQKNMNCDWLTVLTTRTAGRQAVHPLPSSLPSLQGDPSASEALCHGALSKHSCLLPAPHGPPGPALLVQLYRGVAPISFHTVPFLLDRGHIVELLLRNQETNWDRHSKRGRGLQGARARYNGQYCRLLKNQTMDTRHLGP